MGIYNFFRRIIKNRNTEEPKTEKISFSELGTWIENKIREIETKEKEIFSLIQEKTDVFVNEIKVKIRVVEILDINLKKAEDKIKSVVEEGRKKYIESVEYLINNLNNLKNDKLEKIILDTDRIFLDFNKRSHLNYEKATILIGKEMSEIKESLKSFSKDLIKIFNENKDIVDSLRITSIIKLKARQFEKIEEEIKRINEEIFLLDKEIINKEKENKKILEEIEEIKKSPEYYEKLKKQEKIGLLKNDLEKDIFNLRQVIDFKALGNFYHIFEDKIYDVKNHKNDFQSNFQKDNGKGILDLLEEAKLNNKNISDKIDQIHRKKEETLKLEEELENEKNKDRTPESYSKSAKIVLETNNLKNKKLKEEKRLEKFNADKKDILEEIRKNIVEIGAELQ